MALATATLMEAIRPPKEGGHYADDPNLLARANAALGMASAWFEGQVGHAILQATYAWNLNGSGSRDLSVPVRPIITVNSLTVGGFSWAVMMPGDADTTQEAVLAPNGNYLIARQIPWPKGWGNVLLNADAGYATVPDDVAYAVALFAGVLCNESMALGFGGETLGPEHINSLARNPKDYDAVMNTLQNFRVRALT